jgi:predicted transcriptional regulator with HTH domain
MSFATHQTSPLTETDHDVLRRLGRAHLTQGLLQLLFSGLTYWAYLSNLEQVGGKWPPLTTGRGAFLAFLWLATFALIGVGVLRILWSILMSRRDRQGGKKCILRGRLEKKKVLQVSEGVPAYCRIQLQGQRFKAELELFPWREGDSIEIHYLPHTRFLTHSQLWKR